MENRPNKYIEVAYTLSTVKDGVEEQREQMTADAPYQFITGIGFSQEFFESRLVLLEKGDDFNYLIPCAEVFGEYNPKNVQEFARSIFETDGKLDENYIYEGAIIQMNRSDGTPVLCTVKKIGDAQVTVDFNHPFAGCDLRLAGSIVESRPATPQEIMEVLNRQHSCGCGSCGGDCGDHGHEGCGCGHCH